MDWSSEESWFVSWQAQVASVQRCSHWPWGVPSLLFSGYRGAFSLSVSWSPHEAYCLSPSNVSVMNELCSSVDLKGMYTDKSACVPSPCLVYMGLSMFYEASWWLFSPHCWFTKFIYTKKPPVFKVHLLEQESIRTLFRNRLKGKLTPLTGNIGAGWLKIKEAITKAAEESIG